MSQQVIKHRTDPRDAEGIVRCYTHGLPARQQVSGTPLNPGRTFYACPKDRDDPENCKFFSEYHPMNCPAFWADNPVFGKASARAKQPLAINTPKAMTPRSSQKQRASSARTPQRPASTSLKRARSPTPPIQPSPPATPSRAQHRTMSGDPTTPSNTFTPSQKERRLAAVRAALDPDKSSSSRIADIQLGLAEVQGRGVDSDLPPSQKRIRTESTIDTDAVDEDEQERSFWQGGGSAAPTAGPSTPYRLPDFVSGHRPPQAPGQSVSPRARSFGGSQHSGLLTPPRSSQLELDFGPSASQPGMSQPETPTRSKGKGREITTSASQWQKIQDDVENRYHAQATALRSQISPPRGDLPATPGNASADPPLADAVSGVASELWKCSESIRKLERKHAAAQKSLDVKSKRIAELDSEIQSLRAMNRTLEETVHTLTARR